MLLLSGDSVFSVPDNRNCSGVGECEELRPLVGNHNKRVKLRKGAKEPESERKRNVKKGGERKVDGVQELKLTSDSVL